MIAAKTDTTFIHRQSAHCESGVTSSLLSHHGLNVSEPLAFGIGAGIFFGYFPIIKVYGSPFITYRNISGRILKSTAKRLGVRFEKFVFRDPEKAMETLDRVIDKGVAVGLQAGVYWLPYMPDAMRFHFNAHSLIVYGKKEGDYLISDPVLDEPVVCSRKDLMKARFAEGLLAPKGKMYYLSDIPESVDFRRAIEKGIKETYMMMIKAPFPFVGVLGMRTFAKALRKWPDKYGNRKAPLHLGHAIRMQEEIGTGGGGFRLMYAAFLFEAAAISGDDRFLELSKRMTAIGDQWRQFALYGSRICKNRATQEDNFDRLSDIVRDCAEKEYKLYKDLRETIK